MTFSLRALFGVMSAVAVYVAIVFAMPAIVSGIFMAILSYILGPVILTGVIYDRGRARTFWIGCLASGAVPYLWMTYYGYGVFFGALMPNARAFGQMTSSSRVSYTLAFAHLVIVLSGLVAVATRWLIIDRRLECADADAKAAGTTPFK